MPFISEPYRQDCYIEEADITHNYSTYRNIREGSGLLCVNGAYGTVLPFPNYDVCICNAFVTQRLEIKCERFVTLRKRFVYVKFYLGVNAL